jgi:hypothetical protein
VEGVGYVERAMIDRNDDSLLLDKSRAIYTKCRCSIKYL